MKDVCRWDMPALLGRNARAKTQFREDRRVGQGREAAVPTRHMASLDCLCARKAGVVLPVQVRLG
jgi:hypothetical protein